MPSSAAELSPLAEPPACRRCGADRGADGTATHCRACRDGARARSLTHRRRLIAAGLCVQCGKAGVVACQQCRRCWIRQKACIHLKASSLGDLLEEIWRDQGGADALTGEPLAYEDSPSIDHVVPRSKGGTNDRANLRWVSHRINTAKGTMSDAEFVAMCRKVVAWADRA